MKKWEELEKVFDEQDEMKIVSTGKLTIEDEITGICRDNRKAAEGNLFVCIKGVHFDTHNCLIALEESGVKLAVIDHEVEDVKRLAGRMAVILVKDSRRVEAKLEAAWYGNPASKFRTVIGITGSKGKTTITHMIADIMRADGRDVGTIGSNGVIIHGEVFDIPNTTPDADIIQMYLAKMLDEGCDTVVLECSSQGLMQHRLEGIIFDIGVFTNISAGDHVSPIEHKDFEDYIRCKSILLKNSRKAILYSGDIHTKKMIELIGANTAGDAEYPKEVICYGRHDVEQSAHWVTRALEDRCVDALTGLSVLTDNEKDCELIGSDNDCYFATSSEMVEENGEPMTLFRAETGKPGMVSNSIYNMDLKVNLPGDFNITNALCAVSVTAECGISPEAIRTTLAELTIKGRMEMVFENDIFKVCVDFAHNGYSTRNLLTALRAYRPERLICIFGADGNRAISRRTEMGAASGSLADLSVVTSGHNRWESFEDISKDILEYLIPTGGEYMVIKDRKEAIRTVIRNVRKGDLITIIGMGHENYQEENGIKTPYSDKDFTLEVIKERGYI